MSESEKWDPEAVACLESLLCIADESLAEAPPDIDETTVAAPTVEGPSEAQETVDSHEPWATAHSVDSHPKDNTHEAWVTAHESDMGSSSEDEAAVRDPGWSRRRRQPLTAAQLAELNPLGIAEGGDVDSRSEGTRSSLSVSSYSCPSYETGDGEDDDDDSESLGPESIASSVALSNNDVADLRSDAGADELFADLIVPDGFTLDDVVPVIGFRRQEWFLLMTAKELKHRPMKGNGSGDKFRKLPEVHQLLPKLPYTFKKVEITKAEGFDFMAFRPMSLEAELVEMERRMWAISAAMDQTAPGGAPRTDGAANAGVLQPLSPDRLVSGMAVRVWFDQDNADGGTWFRGRLNRIRIEKNTVDVFLVDFGDLETDVELGRLYPLPRALAVLPPLGFECITAIPSPVSPQQLWCLEHDKHPIRAEVWRCFDQLKLGSDEYKARCRDTMAGIHEAKWTPQVTLKTGVGPKFLATLRNPGVIWGPQTLSLRGVELVSLCEEGPGAIAEFKAKAQAVEEEKAQRRAKEDAELAAHRAAIIASLPPLPPKPRPEADWSEEQTRELERDLQPQNLFTSDEYGQQRPVLAESERRRLAAEVKPAPKVVEMPFVYKKPKSQILPRLWERPAEIAIRAWPQRGDNPVLEDQMMMLVYAESTRRMEFLFLDSLALIPPVEEALNAIITDDSPALPVAFHQKYNTCAVRDPLADNRFVRAEIDWANPRDSRGIKIRSVDRGWPLPMIPHSEAGRIKAIPTDAPAIIRETIEMAFPAKIAKMCESAPEEDEAVWIRERVPPGSGVVVNCVSYPAKTKHLRGPPYRIWIKMVQRSRLWMKDLWAEFLDFSIEAKIGIRGPERGKSDMDKIIDSPTAKIRQMQHKGLIPAELTQIRSQSPEVFAALKDYRTVRITHVGTCNSVWVQTEEMATRAKTINSDVTGTMQEELRAARTGLGVPPLYHWELEIGKSVVARFRHDRCYYRATIIDFHPPKPKKGDKEALAALGGLWFPLKAQIRFADYGNSDWVDAKELYIVRPELCFMEPCAVGPCRLLSPKAFTPHFDMGNVEFIRYLQFTLIHNGYQFKGRIRAVAEDDQHGGPQWHLDLVDEDQVINFNDYWEKFVSGRKPLPTIDASRVAN